MQHASEDTGVSTSPISWTCFCGLSGRLRTRSTRWRYIYASHAGSRTPPFHSGVRCATRAMFKNAEPLALPLTTTPRAPLTHESLALLHYPRVLYERPAPPRHIYTRATAVQHKEKLATLKHFMVPKTTLTPSCEQRDPSALFLEPDRDDP